MTQHTAILFGSLKKKSRTENSSVVAKSIKFILINCALAALGLVILLMHRVKDYEALSPQQATAGCSRSFFTGSVKDYGGVHVRPIRDVTVVSECLFGSVVPVALPPYGGRAAFFTVHPIYGGAQPTPSCLSNLFVFVRFKEKAPKASHICHTYPLKETVAGCPAGGSFCCPLGKKKMPNRQQKVVRKNAPQNNLDERPLSFV